VVCGEELGFVSEKADTFHIKLFYLCKNSVLSQCFNCLLLSSSKRITGRGGGGGGGGGGGDTGGGGQSGGGEGGESGGDSFNTDFTLLHKFPQ